MGSKETFAANWAKVRSSAICITKKGS